MPSLSFSFVEFPMLLVHAHRSPGVTGSTKASLSYQPTISVSAMDPAHQGTVPTCL
jgi:hypothetical protein